MAQFDCPDHERSRRRSIINIDGGDGGGETGNSGPGKDNGGSLWSQVEHRVPRLFFQLSGELWRLMMF